MIFHRKSCKYRLCHWQQNTIEFRDIGDSLRCAEAPDRMNSFALSQVEHFDGVIAKRTNKQSFASGIEREMVDASFDTW